MRARSWAEQRAIKRWYDARGGNGEGRAPYKFMAVSEAMSGADERDAHSCPSCGEFSGRHWIGCPVHVYNVLTRRPVFSQPEAKPVDMRTLFVLSI